MRKIQFNLHTLMGKNKIKSINELSKRTGISRPTLTKIYDNETTRVEFDTLQKLCDFFDCDLEELMYLETSEEE
ncbi:MULTISPECIES: helix-turn-helix domain-containing protein [Alkalihalophilus]|uniref:helix-turn-helix domain-containing protein n=1 Tax=Alkalihalophilus TaxID=2893060 RepID=UPI000951DB3A|nr:helix-turn-helix transcriptional regulator [Alkalihalophilus marmarensis]MEC2070309.1 helix-turn-helix transcriptional regulator [Alkalihalophilus marmarensis]OLS34423.1 hypothetical protein BTR22_18505 [Alkalihalophilus pseudofirmus]